MLTFFSSLVSYLVLVDVVFCGLRMRTFSLGMSSSMGMKPDLRSSLLILFSSCL